MKNISPKKHIAKKFVIKVLLIGAYWRWDLAKKWKKIWEDCGCIALTSLTKDTPQFRQHKFLCIHMLPAVLKIWSLWVHHNYDRAQPLLYWNRKTPVQLTTSKHWNSKVQKIWNVIYRSYMHIIIIHTHACTRTHNNRFICNANFN